MLKQLLPMNDDQVHPLNSTTDDLWRWVMHRYRQPGVENLCLVLQQTLKANVNMVLWAQWLEEHNMMLTPTLLLAGKTAIENWHQHVVSPVRDARYWIKNETAQQQHLQSLYDALKSVELDAERHELKLLHAVSSIPHTDAPASTQAGNNVRNYLHTLGVDDVSAAWIITLGQK
jgi:uncharacterized protein (TIGR02444 family)